MSGDEPFLARWSRRKRDVTVQSDAGKNPPPSAAEIAKPVSPTTVEASATMPLPPIEAIESASQLQAFLAPGVPLELTRAALRQAWTADPAIRDFIGLSENAWDFNAPGGVPGFGSLDLEDIHRLVGQVLDEPQVSDAIAATAPLADASATPAEAGSAVAIAEPRESIVAGRHENDESKVGECRPRRRHGGALPQ
jgi:hypothetical protein